MGKRSTYIWDGTLSFAVKSMKADNSRESLELSNLKCDYTLDYDEENNSLSIGMEYGMDYITSGQDFIKNAFARIRINRIDARGYEDFMKIYSQIVNNAMEEIAALQHHPDIMKKAVEKQMAAIGLQMLGTYEKFLKKGFEIPCQSAL